ncbi:hypothetical protein PFISCL1PPCAC_20647, partial [Pristionchus fissidentatus]
QTSKLRSIDVLSPSCSCPYLLCGAIVDSGRTHLCLTFAFSSLPDLPARGIQLSGPRLPQRVPYHRHIGVDGRLG